MESWRTSLASRTSSRTHFEVLGLEASSPRTFPWPRLEDSTIFWIVEILFKNARNLAENFWRPFFVLLKWRSPEKNFLKIFLAWKKIMKSFFWDRLKKILEDFFFFLENTCACVFGPWPWPREGLSLASKFFCVLGLGLEPYVLDSTSGLYFLLLLFRNWCWKAFK